MSGVSEKIPPGAQCTTDGCNRRAVNPDHSAGLYPKHHTNGAALPVAATVYSVSWMSVRDRLATIQVVRGTDGTPRTILSISGLRASLLTAVGVALGYPLGVIAASTAVNIAVQSGCRRLF